MPDRRSMPAPAPLAQGQITRVSVTYTVPAEDGPYHALLSLKMMRDSARADRVADLVHDLTVICEELLAARSSAGTLPATVARLPYQGPPGRREAFGNLLAAVRDALDCPPPADGAGEAAFSRLRSERARLVLAALRPVLADRDSGPAQMTEAARRLRDRVAACPADGYPHSPLCT
jgi:hypothetical protein